MEAEGIEYRVVTFDDAGAKDVTEFLQNHPIEEFVRRVNIAWNGTVNVSPAPNDADLVDEPAVPI